MLLGATIVGWRRKCSLAQPPPLANYRYLCLLVVIVMNDDHRTVLIKASILKHWHSDENAAWCNHCGAATKMLLGATASPHLVLQYGPIVSWSV